MSSLKMFGFREMEALHMIGNPCFVILVEGALVFTVIAAGLRGRKDLMAAQVIVLCINK